MAIDTLDRDLCAHSVWIPSMGRMAICHKPYLPMYSNSTVAHTHIYIYIQLYCFRCFHCDTWSPMSCWKQIQINSVLNGVFFGLFGIWVCPKVFPESKYLLTTLMYTSTYTHKLGASQIIKSGKRSGTTLVPYLRSIPPFHHTPVPYLFEVSPEIRCNLKTVGIGTFTRQLFELNSFRLRLSYAWLGMGMYVILKYTVIYVFLNIVEHV